MHGSSEVVKSDVLKLQPSVTPDPPSVHVTVVGLEERRSIEKVTGDLINKRDRYVSTEPLDMQVNFNLFNKQLKLANRKYG